MRIPNNDNISFKAIYRVPYSEKTLNEIKQHILPTYEKTLKQKSSFFVGRNPEYEGFKFWINVIAKQNNSSVEWLKQNASNNGANTKGMDENFIHIMTGEKDIQAISDYKANKLTSSVEKLKKNIKEQSTIRHKIKKLFVKEKQPDLGYDENTPEHLVVLFQFIKKDKEDTLLFNTTFPDIIKTKDAEELATKIMSEQ